MSGCQQFKKGRVDTRLWWWCFFLRVSSAARLRELLHRRNSFYTSFTLKVTVRPDWRFRVAPGYKPPNDCHETWSDTKRCNSTNSSLFFFFFFFLQPAVRDKTRREWDRKRLLKSAFLRAVNVAPRRAATRPAGAAGRRYRWNRV